jgi:hypothetical protein
MIFLQVFFIHLLIPSFLFKGKEAFFLGVHRNLFNIQKLPYRDFLFSTHISHSVNREEFYEKYFCVWSVEKIGQFHKFHKTGGKREKIFFGYESSSENTWNVSRFYHFCVFV